MKTATFNEKGQGLPYQRSSKTFSRGSDRWSSSKTPEKTEDHPNLFKPIINQRSHKLLKKTKKASQNCWENLYEDSISKKHKIDAARKQEFENEFKNTDFTFHPLIISRTKSSIDLVTRTYSWLKQKNDKINLKAELEIQLLNEKMDHLLIHQNKKLLEIQELQTDYLEDLLRQLKKN